MVHFEHFRCTEDEVAEVSLQEDSRLKLSRAKHYVDPPRYCYRCRYRYRHKCFLGTVLAGRVLHHPPFNFVTVIYFFHQDSLFLIVNSSCNI